MRSWKMLLLGILVVISPHAVAAADRPVVVELFTFQGCSSCPPANAFLNELFKQRSDVLALAFHVTYLALPGLEGRIFAGRGTDRQARYGQRFGDGSYTPEIVVDGAIGLVGSDRDDVNSAIAKARAENRTSAEVRVVAKDGKLLIDVGSVQKAPRRSISSVSNT